MVSYLSRGLSLTTWQRDIQLRRTLGADCFLNRCLKDRFKVLDTRIVGGNHPLKLRLHSRDRIAKLWMPLRLIMTDEDWPAGTKEILSHILIAYKLVINDFRGNL